MKRLLIAALALVGILSAGCIVQFGTTYVDTDGTHFVALASNLTKADIVAASVEVDFYDSSNNLVGTEFSSPCTRTLQNHSAAPVEAILPSGVTVDHVKTVVKPVSFGTKTQPDIDITDVSTQTSSGTTHITGSVKNNASTHLYAVQACVAILDSDGNVLRVGQAFTAPADIAQDDTTRFDISVKESDDAHQYELWVDAVTHTPKDVTAPVVVGPKNIATATPTKTATPGTPTATATPTSTSTP